MKKITSLFCVVWLVLTAIWVLPVFGEVNDDPKTGPIPMGSPRGTLWVGQGQTYTKIQDAIDAAIPGDTIRVMTGAYMENLIINKTLNIIGNGTWNSIVNGTTNDNIVFVQANWVNISGFTFTNYGIYWGAGVKINSSNNCTITNCNLSKNTYGIELFGANYNKIINCIVWGNSYTGIYIRDTVISSSNNNEIWHSYIYQNLYGAIIEDSDNNIFGNNSIMSSTRHGIMFTTNSDNNTLMYNNISHNKWNGLEIKYSSSTSNTIYLNNFEYNTYTPHAIDNGTGTIWNGSNYGNYWTGWTSPDSNNDKIVDNPYNLAGTANAKDYLPLVNPTYFDAPPQITTVNVLVAFVNELYSVQYTATDLDTPQNQLIWTWSSNASWLTFSASQVLSGTPITADIGNYWVFVNVSDGKFQDSTYFWITVMKRPDGTAIIVRTGQKYFKIQDAVDNAISGDTIRVWTGTYYEQVTINKQLNIIGNGSANTIIDGLNKGSVIIIKANNCNVTDIQTKGAKLSTWPDAGIELFNVNNCFIANNTCNGKTYGINLISSRYNEIVNCTSNSNDGSGINLTGSFGNGSDYNEISNCSFINNFNGIELGYTDGNTIVSNDCNSNTYDGIHVGMGLYAKNNHFRYNVLKENGGYGIFLGAYTNYVYLNNFMNNSASFSQGFDSSNLNRWNLSLGNYWSDWTSPDSDSDGIVDIPYNLSGGYYNKDYKPLVNPTYLVGPPMILTINVQGAFVGQNYSVNYTAYDPDTPQNQLLWTMYTNATWLNFSTTQELYGTPTSSDVGVFWVQINVSDGFYTDSTYFLITVTEFGIPSINTTNVLTAYVGELYSLYYNAYDANTPQNQLLWTMNTNASWLNFSSSQRLFGTPYSSHIGSYWVYISVSDGNFSDSTNFTLTVQVRTQPPGPGTGSVIIVRTGQRFTRIQNAINNATSGDTIRIYSGMYYENIIIDKTLTLRGNGSTNTIINGSNGGSTIRITANSCNISEIDVIDSYIWSGWRDAGILILSDYNYIESCMFYGNDHGIFLSNSDYNIISNCNFIDNNYDDINLSNSNYNIISNCHCYSNNGGMRISNSNYNKIENCTTKNSNLDGIFLCFSDLNIIKHNNCSSNYYAGISLRGSSDYNTILYNNFINNQYGVVTIEGSSYNSIYLNNFINNSGTAQARDTGNGNRWNNSLKGNYWSDWISPDSNNDGIVDFPYNISGNAGAKDYLPLTNIVGQIPPPSNAPIITTSNVLSAYVGVLYSVNYTATDQDTPINLLTWRMRTNASWLNFSSSQRLFGTPWSSDIGSYWVYIEVSDSVNLDSTNFTLTVRSSPPPPGAPNPQINHSSIGNNSHNVSVNNSQIIITFSTSMNRSSVESALSILPTANYTVIWNNNSTQMTILFTENLSYNTTYTITISTSARDTYGNSLNSPYTLIFTTEKEIQIDEPDDDRPDESTDSVDDIAFLGIMIGLILIIIIIVIFTLFIFGKKRMKAEPEEELEETESRVELSGGDIADDYDVDEYSEEEFIKNLIDEVRIDKRPSDFGPSEDEVLDKIRIKYRKGEITKETYDSIKDLLIIKEY